MVVGRFWLAAVPSGLQRTVRDLRGGPQCWTLRLLDGSAAGLIPD
jgi:hypothetical protein